MVSCRSSVNDENIGQSYRFASVSNDSKFGLRLDFGCGEESYAGILLYIATIAMLEKYMNI